MKQFNVGPVEEHLSARSSFSTEEVTPKKLSQVEISKITRVPTGFSEFDRVLGEEAKAGIVPGSVVLLSGDPGVGKSTILLQTALNMAFKGQKVLYVTGEESEAQVTLRAKRLLKKENLVDAALFILATSNIDLALNYAQKATYAVVVIDSIQTMEGRNVPGYAGSIPQVRHATGQLVAFAKGTGTPVLIIGHVTKDGMVAGPMMLSHMVDTVLYLEGEKITGVRILRALKNRFGDTSEVGIFTMQEYGLKEVNDLSELFIGEEVANPGSCIAVVLEGSRPILAEVQALAVHSNLPYPRRIANGIPEKRLELLLAILQKHAKLTVDKFDVFVNVVGGFKIQEPAADLSVCLAIISSLKGITLPKVAAIAEVGLLGEIKKVLHIEKRIKEAKKFGFKPVTHLDAKTIPLLLLKMYK